MDSSAMVLGGRLGIILKRVNPSDVLTKLEITPPAFVARQGWIHQEPMRLFDERHIPYPSWLMKRP
jgi:hypothetical protein